MKIIGSILLCVLGCASSHATTSNYARSMYTSKEQSLPAQPQAEIAPVAPVAVQVDASAAPAVAPTAITQSSPFNTPTIPAGVAVSPTIGDRLRSGAISGLTVYGVDRGMALAHEFGHWAAAPHLHDLRSLRISLMPSGGGHMVRNLKALEPGRRMGKIMGSAGGPLGGAASVYAMLMLSNVYREYQKTGDMKRAWEVGSAQPVFNKDQNIALMYTGMLLVPWHISNLIPQTVDRTINLADFVDQVPPELREKIKKEMRRRSTVMVTLDLRNDGYQILHEVLNGKISPAALRNSVRLGLGLTAYSAYKVYQDYKKGMAESQKATADLAAQPTPEQISK